MVQENLVTNIVAKSDFSDLIADLGKVSSKLVSLQTQLSVTNRTLAAQAAQIQQSFATTLRSTGQFSTQFVSLSSDVEKFGKNLDSGRLKLSQYYQTWQQHAKTSGGLVRQLAQQQVQLQNAILQPLGKNAQGLMQYNVHIPAGLDKTKHAAALARQELQIMNKVMQQGANQLINWGKNTQWAGRQLTVGLTLPLAAFGKAAADAFRLADQELVRLTKVYGGIAATSASDLKKIREDVAATARELSSTYGASYRDTISLAADIAATGKQGNELLKSTQEATRLSILGEVDRQEAMKATLAIQTAFKQNTSQLAESINFLNAVENQTSTSLSDLVEAIPKAGPVVQSLGGSIQDLALYLTAMREGGISASEGANALKSALASLINPTNVAKEKFNSFGIDLEGIVTKNAGNLTGTILELQRALDTLNPLQKQQAIEQLFGKFQFSRLNALFANLGKQGSQTLQVLDLMKASSSDLANIAGRELAQITESASGKYRRALETLRADLAQTGEAFLGIGTKIITIIDKVINFFNKLPDPIKNILAFVGGLTALAGPIIMLTGLLANFFGYIVKGIFHFKSLFKGGEGWKLLTPEILAAEKAGSLLEAQFYSDAKAATVLSSAIANLSNELRLLEARAANSAMAVNPAISTIGGSVIMPGRPSQERVANPAHPLIGGMGTRASMHMNPLANMTQAEKDAQNIFSFVPGPGPVNLKIGRNPQAYMSSDLPKIDKLTSIGGASTGVVAQEAAKWHSMTAALSMQSEQEIAQLKAQVAATGAITDSLSDSYQLLLPQMSEITSNAAQEVALIVSEVKQNKITVDQARARIITLNAQVEAMMAETAAAVAATQGRVANLTTVPLTGQPVVDPVTGRSNMKEMFHKSKTSAIVDKIARGLGVRTYGGGYSIETTMPRRLNSGGSIYMTDGNTVPGPNVNADVVPAMLTPGEFVLTRGTVAREGQDNVQALHEGRATIVPFKANIGGLVPPMQYFAARNAVRNVRGPGISGSLASTIMQLLELRSRQIGGARARFLRTGSGPSTRNITDPSPGYKTYAQLSKRTEGSHWEQLNKETDLRIPSDKDILLHAASRSFRERTKSLKPTKQSETGLATKEQLQELGIDVSDSAYDEFFVLPNNFILSRMKDAKTWNSLLGKPGGAPTSNWKNIYGNDMTSFGITLKDAGVPKSVAKRITATAAKILNQKIKSQSRITHDEFGDFVEQAQIEAVRLHSMKAKFGGMIPGYNGGGMPKFAGKGRKDWITYLFDLASARRKFIGPIRKPRSLINDDPAHGPLQIGHYWPEMRSRLSYFPPTIRYNPSAEDVFHRGMDPSKHQVNIAWPVGSAEAQAQYMVDQYVRGGYDIMRVPNAAKILRAAATKRSGTFYRGTTLPLVSTWSDGNIRITPKMTPAGTMRSPFPDEIVLALDKAKRTGDYSELIGKRFIMSRSSWSSNPQTARGFGDFFIESDVNNRRMVPMSEMTPGLTFDTPKGKVAVDESEFYFGGEFEIVSVGPNGMKLKSIPGAVQETRQPGAARLFDPIAKREKGGPTRKNMPYIVGEKGPELFVPEGNGTIVPNSKLARFKNAGPVGGSTATRRVNPAKFSGPPVFTGGVLGNVVSQIMQPLTNALSSATAIYGGGLLSAGETAKEQAALAASQTKTGILMYGQALKDMPLKVGVQAQMAGKSITDSMLAMGTAISGAGKAAATSIGTTISSVRKSIAGISIAGMREPAQNWNELLRTQKSFLPASKTMLGKLTGAGSPAGAAAANIAGQTLLFSGMGSGNKAAMAGGTALMFGPQLLGGAAKLLTTFKSTGGIVFNLARILKTLSIPGLVLTGAFMLGKYLLNARKEREALNKAEAATGGAKAENVKKIASGYESLGDRIKRAREEQRLYEAATKNALSSGNIKMVKGLTLTYEQLKDAIKSVKQSSPEIVGEFKNAPTQQDVIEIAKNYKAAFIASGMSVQEATNSVYALISAAGKGKQAVIAIADEGFAKIQTKSDAAKTSINSLNNAIAGDNKDSMAQSLLSASDIITQSGMGINEINSGLVSTKQIGTDVKNIIASQNEELGKVILSTDTFKEVLAKAKILASGLKVDFTTMSGIEIFNLANFIDTTTAKTDKFISANKIFDGLNAKVAKLTGSQNAYSAAIEKSAQKISDQRDAAQEAADKEKQAIQDKIDLINKEADARLKALDATKASADFESELAQATLEYQNAVATGNVQAAASAKARIDQVNRDRQYELARTAIEDERSAKIESFTPELKRIDASLKKTLEALKSSEKVLSSKAQTAQYGTPAIDTSKVSNATNMIQTILNKFNLILNPTEQQKQDAIMGIKLAMADLPKELQDAMTSTWKVNGETLDKKLNELLDILIKSNKYSASHDEMAGMARDYAGKASSAAQTGKGSQESLPLYTGTILANGTLAQDDLSKWENGKVPKIGKRFRASNGQIYKITGYNSIDNTYSIIKAKAMGGFVTGPGNGTSDSIPAMLSNGEYVIKASAVRNIGVPMLDQINRMAGGGLAARYDIPNMSMGAVKYANGGLVSSQTNSAVFNFTFEAKIHPDDRRALINDTITAYKQQTRLEEIRMGRSLTYTAGGN